MSTHIDSPDPWWAPGADSGFRQRCASALTHPVTVVALATLLLNDLLLKALWPQAWVTGKLSDLAWVIFALPLLAFLLSLFTRGSVVAARVAFLTAYAGLPLLYAAFNTFEPVHYWILRGITLVSGGMGRTPLDATDSIVIPLGWALAVWVWRRPVLSNEALRMRLGLLVAGVAVLASIATSPVEPDRGVTRVGVLTTNDESVFVADTDGYWYWSSNGGMNWHISNLIDWNTPVVWWGDSVSTPRGKYTIDGADIVLHTEDSKAETVYSTDHLLESGNLWTQEQATKGIGTRILATHPQNIAYDERSGNVVIALGIQGVVVGTPDGQWAHRAVGPYSPTDFSFLRKTLVLIAHWTFWMVALVTPLTMTGGSLILARRADCFMTVIAILSILSSGALILMFGNRGTDAVGSPTFMEAEGDAVYMALFYLIALTLGTISMVAGCQLLYWRGIIAALVGMSALVFLAFMLWLHLGISLALAKVSAFGLIALVAFLLAGYIRRRSREGPSF